MISFFNDDKRGIYNGCDYIVKDVKTFNDHDSRNFYYIAVGNMKVYNQTNFRSKEAVQAKEDYEAGKKFKSKAEYDAKIKKLYEAKIKSSYIKVSKEIMNAVWQEKTDDKKNNDIENKREKLEFTYASTVHSAQGDEWDTVAICVKGIDFDKRNKDASLRLIYTAITRGKTVIIYDPDGVFPSELMTDKNPELEKARQQPDFNKNVNAENVAKAWEFFNQMGY